MTKTLAAALFFSSIVPCLPVMAGGRVLVVHSYDADYPWVKGINAGIAAGLAGADVEIAYFYMDTKRIAEDQWKSMSARSAKAKLTSYRPRVVIVVDDNAQEFFARDLVGKDEPQIVFCGVNAAPATYGYPARNVTGVLERPHLEQTLRLLLEIKSDIRTIGVVCDDSATGAASVAYIKKQMVDLALPVTITGYQQPALFKDWKKAIKDFAKSVDAIAIPVYHTVKEVEGGMSMKPTDVMRWTVENCSKPLVGFWEFAITDGCLCGVAVSGTQQGYAAAQLALKVVKGQPAGAIPFQTPTRGTPIVNLATAAALGITIPPHVLKTVVQAKGPARK